MKNTKFKVGDKVKVIRRSIQDEVYWASSMDKTIGGTYIVLGISKRGNLLLDTSTVIGYDYHYPNKGVCKITTKGEQLLFDFMR